MSDRTHFYKERYWVVVGLMLFVIAILLFRDVQLHLYEHDFLKDEGEKRSLRVDAIPAYRGMITDRHGEPLAISTPVMSLWANSKQLIESQKKWPQLAQLLGLSSIELAQKITQNNHKEFFYLKRQIPPDIAEAVLALKIPGLSKIREYHRYYPAAEVTAHLIGFTNIDDQGQEGLELAYDSRLHGEEGRRRVIKDRKGHLVKDLGIEESAQPGRDIQLSIDLRMQYVAYRTLKEAVQQHQAKSASAVAVDVRTGEVLLMVNQPSYNPNNRTALSTDTLRNRAVTDLLEPGSTIKAFTVFAALQTGRFQPNTPIDTNPGKIKVGNKWVKDFHNYGLIDVTRILTKSSNVGATHLAMSLDSPNQLVDLLRLVGFGRRTDSLFPGERDGWLPMKQHWAPVEVATLSYGYGISVTALQLVRAYALLANGGYQVPLTLLKRTSAVSPKLVLNPHLSREVISMLETVVSEAGTAEKAQVPGYRVAGKTGTVHQLAGTSVGYAQNRYISLFAGLAPVSRPQVAMVVIINDPQGDYYGGQVAAPVFSRVMTEILRIRAVAPDQAYQLNM